MSFGSEMDGERAGARIGHAEHLERVPRNLAATPNFAHSLGRPFRVETYLQRRESK